jgi:HK97 family phage major capsid protein
MRDEYERAVYGLAEKGKLGWSSGTAPHLVERNKSHITRWPLGLDASLTPIPADPGNRAMPLKSWAEGRNLKALLEDDAGAARETAPEAESGSVTIRAESVNVTINQNPTEKGTTTEDKTMSEKETKAVDTPRDDWQDRMEKVEAMLAGYATELKSVEGSLTSKIDGLLDALTKSPSLKDAGYISPDSEGNERQAQKSFGDWLLAVRNGNHSRLTKVYGSKKALGEQSGAAGGYLVPEEYENRLMMMAMDASIVRPLATVLTVGSNRGSIPALNHTAVPTAGKGYSPFAGGVVAQWGPEAGSLDSTDPAFQLIEYNINKLQGYTYVSNEMLADSAFSVESLLNVLFGRAVASKEDYAFIRGTGAGEPLGILAADCTIGVATNADNTWALVDALNMLAQFQPVGAGSGSITWVMHRGLLPDFVGNFDVSTGGVDWVQPREGLPGSLLGYPLRMSEHMPNPNTDDVMLCDMAAYLIFDNQGLEISYSEHARFTNDQATWKFTKRLDGQPWLSSYITLGSPVAYTVSPFVYHND